MITVAGMSPSLDLTYVVDELRLGRIHRPSVTVRCAGGKSLNLARAAHTLDADVHLAGIFGGITGQWLVTELERVGIAVSAVRTPAETRTCVSIGSAATAELTEVYPYAEAVPADVWAHLVEVLVARCAERPGWLVISGLTPAGLPPDGLAELITRARAGGTRVAVDTHGAALSPAVAARPELTKINRSEAAGLLQVGEDTDLRTMAVAIADRTDAAVVLTDGTAGATGLNPDGCWQIPAHPVSGAFPVGSGDSFLGGLVAALDRGEVLPTALRWAAACGTANAMVPGAGAFSAEAARSIHDQVRLVRLS